MKQITTLMLDDVAYGIYVSDEASKWMEIHGVAAYQIADAARPIGYVLQQLDGRIVVVRDADTQMVIVLHVRTNEIIILSVAPEIVAIEDGQIVLVPVK